MATTMSTRSLIFLFLIIIIPLNITAVNPAKILVFIGGGTYSHKLSVWPLVTALADKGHDVTVLSGYQKEPVSNPKVRNLFSTAISNMISGVYKIDRVVDRLEGKHTRIMTDYNSNIVKTCETIMYSKDDPVLEEILHISEFDLVINNMILGECGVMLAHMKRAKLILYASCPFISWFYDEFGFPDEPAVVPDQGSILNNFIHPMGIWSRFMNYLEPLYWYLTRKFFVYPKLEEIMKKGYNLEEKDVPDFGNLYRSKTDLILLATHHSTDFARSFPPFMVPVGGMQCFLPSEPLKGEFKDVLDSATDGAILIAFGSTINLASLPEEIKAAFLEMMGKFSKIKFVWRWDGPEPENKPENLIISKWLPQFQILGHPNLRAFISHAGLNSVTEAVFHGVPVILLPLFADQDYNGYRIEATKVGIRLEMREISTKVLVEAVEQVLTNPTYCDNMKKMSEMFKDRPLNPIETAVYWTEFVLKHDDLSSLKPLQTVAFYERRFLDSMLMLFVIVSITILTLLAAARVCFNLIYNQYMTRKNCIHSRHNCSSKKLN